MSDRDESSRPREGEERIDLSESFSHGAQMISAPPPADAEIPQALLDATSKGDPDSSSDS
jgi:hypothetical protein